MATRTRDAERARRRRTHVGRLLLELSQHFERESVERLYQRGHEQLTRAQLRVVVALPLAGTRTTTLAHQLGVTKQTMMKLVDGLERQGYVERVDDPDDLRAKRVRPTTRGRMLLDDGLEVVGQLQAEMRALLPDCAFDRLLGDLSALVTGLGIVMPDGYAESFAGMPGDVRRSSQGKSEKREPIE